MHVPCSLWPFLVSSKSHCLQDLLIEKTRSHNPILCKNVFHVKTSKLPRSCNCNTIVQYVQPAAVMEKEIETIESSADRINLCTKICSVTQAAKYPGDGFFPQAYIHFDKSLHAKCSGEWILGRGVDRIYESNQAFKISHKDKE